MIRSETCECRGECGSDHPRRGADPKRCAVPDGIRIMRSVEKPVYWYWPLALWLMPPNAPFRPVGRQKLERVKTVLGLRWLCTFCIGGIGD